MAAKGCRPEALTGRTTRARVGFRATRSVCGTVRPAPRHPSSRHRVLGPPAPPRASGSHHGGLCPRFSHQSDSGRLRAVSQVRHFPRLRPRVPYAHVPGPLTRGAGCCRVPATVNAAAVDTVRVCERRVWSLGAHAQGGVVGRGGALISVS